MAFIPARHGTKNTGRRDLKIITGLAGSSTEEREMSCTAGTRMQLNQSSTKMGFLDALSDLVNHDELPRSTRGPESRYNSCHQRGKTSRGLAFVCFTTACHRESSPSFSFFFFSFFLFSISFYLPVTSLSLSFFLLWFVKEIVRVPPTLSINFSPADVICTRWLDR